MFVSLCNIIVNVTRGQCTLVGGVFLLFPTFAMSAFLQLLFRSVGNSNCTFCTVKFWNGTHPVDFSFIWLAEIRVPFGWQDFALSTSSTMRISYPKCIVSKVPHPFRYVFRTIRGYSWWSTLFSLGTFHRSCGCSVGGCATKVWCFMNALVVHTLSRTLTDEGVWNLVGTCTRGRRSMFNGPFHQLITVARAHLTERPSLEFCEKKILLYLRFYRRSFPHPYPRCVCAWQGIYLSRCISQTKCKVLNIQEDFVSHSICILTAHFQTAEHACEKNVYFVSSSK